MKTNEAKVKFVAETGEFNDTIKKSVSTMSQLSAEIRLCDTQMKTSGESVEALENKHNLLEKQLGASQDKVEALNQKLSKAIEIFGEDSSEVARLKNQLTNAQIAEEKLKQSVNECKTKIEEHKKATEENRTAGEKLTESIEKQQEELEDLKSKYVDAVLQYGKNSKEAKQLAKEIQSLSGELKENQTEMAQAENKADKFDKTLDKTGKTAKESGDGFTVMKGAVADLVSDAIQGAISKLKELIGWLAALPEETREIRQDMSTLTTSFETMGFSQETATKTWKELYAVFGEDDRAVETANHISKIATNQEELNKWVTITTGIWGTYQDSLPVEGLAEASNETIKTGQVTGVLADALNWSAEASQMFAKYMSEDVTTAEDAFNVALSECNTEAERQSLITETLNALYGESAEKYRESSAAQLDAKDATAEQILAENNLATAIEPVTTAWQEMKNELLVGITPAIEEVSGAMTDALGWMQEHPTAMKIIVSVIAVLAAAFTTLTVVVAAYTVAQWAMNSAILANPITWIIVGIVAAIAAVIAIVVLVIEHWDQLKAAAVDTANKVKDTFVKIKDAIVQPIEKARDKIKGIVETIKGFFTGTKLSFPNIKLPHFSIKPKGWKIGDLLQGSIPSLGIEWYAKGGILTRPTIFGMNGNRAMVGGEAGAEAILPIDRLEGYIENAILRTQRGADLTGLVDAIEDLADRKIELKVNDRTIAETTAGASDDVNGLRSHFRSRGLVLE